MQTAIFILVILTLIRGASIIGKALQLGSVKKQVSIAEEKLEKLKSTTDGPFITAFFFMLLWGGFLFGISIYILIQFI